MKNRILIWGELPPKTITGISVSNQYIITILENNDFDVDLVEEFTWNKNVFVKIIRLLKAHFLILRKTILSPPDTYYYNISLSLFGLIKAIFFIFPVFLFSKKTMTIAHIHRGDIGNFLDEHKINRILFYSIIKKTKRLIVLSEKFKKDVNSFFEHDDIQVLHNTSSFEQKELRSKEYQKKYLCISNYIQSKGIKELVQCFCDNGLSDLQLTIYGNVYDQNLFKDINEIATNNIKLNFAIERNKIENTMKQYDCLLLPSWNEGQPIILLEAMSLGIPIISTKVGDIPNILGDDYEYYAMLKNVDSLKKAILKFDQTTQKYTIADYLLNRYLSRYSNDSYGKKVLGIFTKK